MGWSAQTGALVNEIEKMGIDLGAKHNYMGEDGNYDEETLPHVVEVLIKHIQEQNLKIKDLTLKKPPVKHTRLKN